MERILNVHILKSDYSDPINALCVLLGRNGIEYLDYTVIECLYQMSEEDNSYRSRN